MKSVDIFIGINGIEHFLFVDLLGERQLHQNAMNGIILIVFVYQG